MNNWYRCLIAPVSALMLTEVLYSDTRTMLNFVSSENNSIVMSLHIFCLCIIVTSLYIFLYSQQKKRKEGFNFPPVSLDLKAAHSFVSFSFSLPLPWS